VCDQVTSKKEETKARYRAVENTTTIPCNAKKTNKQINKKLSALGEEENKLQCA
jgi:hypothetical protein